MPREARRIPTMNGGPEGKLRGRPPPPVEPRSGPWRRTGSESIAGRAQTRRSRSIAHSSPALQLGPPDKARKASLCGRFRRRRPAPERELAQGERRIAQAQARDLDELLGKLAELQLLDRTNLCLRRPTRPHE